MGKRVKGSDKAPIVLKSAYRRRGSTNGAVTDGLWWQHADPSEALWATSKIIDRQQEGRRFLSKIYIAMYENRLPFTLGPQAPSPRPSVGFTVFGGLRVTLNVVKSVIDTVESLIAKNKAEIRIVTSGGTWKQWKKSRQATKLLSGLFHQADIYNEAQKVFRDGCKTPMGWMRIWPDKRSGKIRCARVLPEEISWNEAEGTSPPSLYRTYQVARESLRALYPKHTDAIDTAPAAAVKAVKSQRARLGLLQYADLVDVVEAWHLPPGVDDDGKPVGGRWVKAIQGTTLEEEPWKYEFFPLVPFSWDDSHDGYGGIPMAETASGYQVALNRKLRTIIRGQELACVPRVWREATSAESPDEQNTNEPGMIGSYTGSPPVAVPGQAFGPEVYNFLDWLYRKCFEELGVSQMQAQGTKPAGIESGEAITAYNDITTTRHVVKGQRFERFFEKCARVMLAMARDLYAEGHKVRVLAPGTKFLEEIDWKEFDMEEDEYALQSFAVSFLPQHPVGRLDSVLKLLKGGLLPQEYALSLLGFPDLEKITTLETAQLELAMMMCERALYDGEYVVPEPFQDLDLLKRAAQKYYLEAKMLKDVPEKNMELLRRLMADSAARLAKMQPAPAPAAAPLPGAAGPGGQPVMPMGAEQLQLPSPAVPSTVPA